MARPKTWRQTWWGRRILKPLLNFQTEKFVVIEDWRLGVALTTLQFLVICYTFFNVYHKATFLRVDAPVTTFSILLDRTEDAENPEILKDAFANLPYCNPDLQSAYEFSYNDGTGTSEDLSWVRKDMSCIQTWGSGGTLTSQDSFFVPTMITEIKTIAVKLQPSNGYEPTHEDCPPPESMGLSNISYMGGSSVSGFRANTCLYERRRHMFNILPEFTNVRLWQSYRMLNMPKPNMIPDIEVLDFEDQVTRNFDGTRPIDFTLGDVLGVAGIDLDKPYDEQPFDMTEELDVTLQGTFGAWAGKYPVPRLTGLSITVDFQFNNYGLHRQPGVFDSVKIKRRYNTVTARMRPNPRLGWVSLGDDLHYSMPQAYHPFWVQRDMVDAHEPFFLHVKTWDEFLAAKASFNATGTTNRRLLDANEDLPEGPTDKVLEGTENMSAAERRDYILNRVASSKGPHWDMVGADGELKPDSPRAYLNRIRASIAGELEEETTPKVEQMTDGANENDSEARAARIADAIRAAEKQGSGSGRRLQTTGGLADVDVVAGVVTNLYQHGIQVHFRGTGVLGVFDVTMLLGALVDALVLLGFAQVTVNTVCLYCLGMRSRLYFDAVREKINYHKEYARFAAQAIIAAYVFKAMDEDNTGELDRHEVHKAIKSCMGQSPDMNEHMLACLTDFLMRNADEDDAHVKKGRARASGMENESTLSLNEWVDIFTEPKANMKRLGKIIDMDYKDLKDMAIEAARRSEVAHRTKSKEAMAAVTRGMLNNHDNPFQNKFYEDDAVPGASCGFCLPMGLRGRANAAARAASVPAAPKHKKKVGGGLLKRKNSIPDFDDALTPRNRQSNESRRDTRTVGFSEPNIEDEDDTFGDEEMALGAGRNPRQAVVATADDDYDDRLDSTDDDEGDWSDEADVHEDLADYQRSKF